MNKIWLIKAMQLNLPYFEREDKDEFLYIATKEQLADAAQSICEQWEAQAIYEKSYQTIDPPKRIA